MEYIWPLMKDTITWRDRLKMNKIIAMTKKFTNRIPVMLGIVPHRVYDPRGPKDGHMRHGVRDSMTLTQDQLQDFR